MESLRIFAVSRHRRHVLCFVHGLPASNVECSVLQVNHVHIINISENKYLYSRIPLPYYCSSTHPNCFWRPCNSCNSSCAPQVGNQRKLRLRETGLFWLWHACMCWFKLHRFFPFTLGFSILWCTNQAWGSSAPPTEARTASFSSGSDDERRPLAVTVGPAEWFLTAESWAIAGWRRTNCGSSSCTQKPSLWFHSFLMHSLRCTTSPLMLWRELSVPSKTAELLKNSAMNLMLRCHICFFSFQVR